MKQRLILAAVALVFLKLAVPVAAQTTNTTAASFSAGLVRGFPGRTVDVPLTLRHTGTVSAVQFDLVYPSAKLTAGALQSATQQTNLVVRSRQMSPGLYRVLAYTKDRVVARTNTTFGQLPFSVPAGDFTGGGRITISNALASSTVATAVTPLKLVNGGVLLSPVFPGDDGVVDLFLTVQSNLTYVIQASDDLIQWVNLSTNFALLDYIVFTDAAAVGHPMRFYRAVPITQAGQITGVRLQGGGLITFNYPTVSGQSYVLQASTNLISWQNLGTNIAGGNILAFTNLIDPAFGQGFYRVRELP